MIKEALNNTKKEPKKANTVVVKGTITEKQRKILLELVGVIGSNEQDVVGKIITLWLYNEGFLNMQSISKSKNEPQKE